MANRFTVKVPGYRGLPDLPSSGGQDALAGVDLPQQLTYAPPHDQWGMIQPLDTTSMMLQQLQAHQQRMAQQQQNQVAMAGALPGMYDAIAGNPQMQQAVSGMLQPFNPAAAQALNVPYTPRNPFGDVKTPNPPGTPDVPQTDDGKNDWMAYKGKAAAKAFARLSQGARPSQMGEIANRSEQEGQWAMTNHPLYKADNTTNETNARLKAENSPEAIKSAVDRQRQITQATTTAHDEAKDDSPTPAQRQNAVLAEIKRRDAQAKAKGASIDQRSWGRLPDGEKYRQAGIAVDGSLAAGGGKGKGKGSDADAAILNALQRLK